MRVGIRALSSPLPGASFLRRHLICRFQMCQTFRQRENGTHIWGECTICGKQSGKTSREAIRRYIEAEEIHRAFLAKQKHRLEPRHDA